VIKDEMKCELKTLEKGSSGKVGEKDIKIFLCMKKDGQ
jgi:hypothetical protein